MVRRVWGSGAVWVVHVVGMRSILVRAGAGGRGCGNVEGRVPVEEVVGGEGEAAGVHRHDGPVLGAREVREAECVPEDEVRVLEGRVVGDERGESLLACALVDDVAGGNAPGRRTR